MRKGVAVTLTVTLFTVVGAYPLQRPQLPAEHSDASPVMCNAPALPALPPDVVSPPRQAADTPATGQRRDLYGNDITDAIATYKLDALGSQYEEHSPDTEVPQLKPPIG